MLKEQKEKKKRKLHLHFSFFLCIETVPRWHKETRKQGSNRTVNRALAWFLIVMSRCRERTLEHRFHCQASTDRLLKEANTGLRTRRCFIAKWPFIQFCLLFKRIPRRNRLVPISIKRSIATSSHSALYGCSRSSNALIQYLIEFTTHFLELNWCNEYVGKWQWSSVGAVGSESGSPQECSYLRPLDRSVYSVARFL